MAKKKKKELNHDGATWTTNILPGDEVLQSLPGRRGYGYKGGGDEHKSSPLNSPIAVRRGATSTIGPAVIPDMHTQGEKASPPVNQRNYYPNPLPGYVPPPDIKAPPTSNTTPKPKGGKGDPKSDRAKVIEQAMGAHHNPGGRTAELGLAAAAEAKRRSLYTPINPGEALPTLKQVRINDLLSDSQGHREEQKKLYPITHPTAVYDDHSARVDRFLGDTVMGGVLKEARINSLLEKTRAGDLANEMSLSNLIEKSMSERSKIEKLLRSSGDYKERTAELLNSTPKPKKKKKKK